MSERMPVRVYSVLSDDFVYGFLVMARTFIATNPDLDPQFRVLYHPDYSPISDDHRAWLQQRLGDALVFQSVDISGYDTVFRLRDQVFKTPRRLWAAFLVLEAFADDEDGAVLCMDSDLICLRPFERSVLQAQGFAAVEACDRDGNGLGYVNTGVMVLGRNARGQEPYQRIMAHTDTSGYRQETGRADQALINLVVPRSQVVGLDARYNVTRRQVPTRGLEAALEQRQAVVFHYVGAKPWHVSLDPRDVDDHEAVALWDRTVEAHLDGEERLRYLAFWRDRSRAVARDYSRRMYAGRLQRFMMKWVRKLAVP